MNKKPPMRPKGDTIDLADPQALHDWAVWFSVKESMLVRLVRIAGSSAGQIEYILGTSKRPHW
jgi:hypothetical protein